MIRTTTHPSALTKRHRLRTRITLEYTPTKTYTLEERAVMMRAIQSELVGECSGCPDRDCRNVEAFWRRIICGSLPPFYRAGPLDRQCGGIRHPSKTTLRCEARGGIEKFLVHGTFSLAICSFRDDEKSEEWTKAELDSIARALRAEIARILDLVSKERAKARARARATMISQHFLVRNVGKR